MKKLIIGALILSLGIIGMQGVYSAATVTGKLKVSWHFIPILKDEAWAYTGISWPTDNVLDCTAYTTVKIYNSSGSYDYASDTEYCAADLPLNTGAKAYMRAAVKAVGTHKAKSSDTNYQWISTKNTVWEK